MSREASFNGFVVTFPEQTTSATDDGGTESATAAEDESQGEEMQNTVVAAETLLAYRLVVPTPSGLVLADPEEPSHRFRMLGMTTVGVAAGEVPTLQTNGFINNPTSGVGAWNLVIGEPVYLAAGGNITSILSGDAVRVGMAASANSIKLSLPLYSAPSVDSKQEVTATTNATSVDVSSGAVSKLTLSVDTTLTLTGGQGYEEISMFVVATSSKNLSFADDITLPNGTTEPLAIARDTLLKFKYDVLTETYWLTQVIGYGSAY